ncbi:kinase-like domain-containing protein [Rhizophagus clarus]|uniref:Kinase-like domain-containing protein n=1 Tax=Rhizophagus clarus TaxID=94130 RepID=A0A8H3LKV7_9GLOM|nr:kinase-like domain-containing protein [Rhizophagus clarus]
MDSFLKNIKNLAKSRDCDCNFECNAKRFKQKFKNWTSGNIYVDEIIQDTQLSDHNYDSCVALEWIPYDRLYEIKYLTGSESDKVYSARWIDGYIDEWDKKNQNWERKGQNMFVTLKSLNNSTSITLEFINKIAAHHKIYGMTQDLETKNYMVVFDNKCEKCKYECNTVYFQRNFDKWTSGDNDIDKFIQSTQLSAHRNITEALEWIPYDRLYEIKYLTGSESDKVYSAGWIDGNICEWDSYFQAWKRNNKHIFVTLKGLNNSTSITLEFINKIAAPYKIYGITQDLETKNYMVVFDNKCEKCKYECNAIYFQCNFDKWTSDNDDIDKFIQSTQLSAHSDITEALEWIPYGRLYNIKYLTGSETNKMYSARWIDGTQLSAHRNITEALEWIPYGRLYNIKYLTESETDKVYSARLTDGNICKWNSYFQDWEKNNEHIFVILKSLNNLTSITLEFINKIAASHKIYGITQNSETKNYMVVFDNNCEKCKYECNAIYFQRNFDKWTSEALEWIPYGRLYNIKYLTGSETDKVYKFINKIAAPHKIYGITQDLETKNYMGTQLSDHIYNSNKFHALEWIPYNKFYDITYVAKGGFGKVYRAKWIDGYIDKWDNKNQNWERKDLNTFVALKSLNNSKNITLEFMNEITLHYKVNFHKSVIKLYGITQDPETENYIMVLDYAENGNLRSYLNTSYNELSWNKKLNYLHSIAHGLKNIHEKGLIHQDLHIGNILRLKNITCIADMGFCKPVDYDALENTKNKIYGVLPYVSPEILRGQNYTEAADIYSFGIIMYEVISGLPPYHDVSHDYNLAIKICKGLRPRFNIKVPQLVVQLIKRCLDADPLNRPKAEKIKETLSLWFRETHPDRSYVFNNPEIKEQIKEVERINNELSAGSTFSTSLGLSYETHSEAIYTKSLQIDIYKSNNNHLLDLKNSSNCYGKNDNINTKFSESLQVDIPEPENPVDYFEENNIINMESSESLQIDISQLNIDVNKNDQNSKSKNE